MRRDDALPTPAFFRQRKRQPKVVSRRRPKSAAAVSAIFRRTADDVRVKRNVRREFRPSDRARFGTFTGCQRSVDDVECAALLFAGRAQ